MDLRKIAAEEAVKYIKNNTTVGFGGGASIAYAIELLSERIKNENLTIQVITSSSATKEICKKYSIPLNEEINKQPLDLYFDGCDQFDFELNALKSGAGIHTLEKICASLATEFILLGDNTKRTDKFDIKYPVVVDVLPSSLFWVMDSIKKTIAGSNPKIRVGTNNETALTENGNILVDIWFDIFPEPKALHQQLKSITGVIETSLFIGLAHKAIVASPDGVETYIK